MNFDWTNGFECVGSIAAIPLCFADSIPFGELPVSIPASVFSLVPLLEGNTSEVSAQSENKGELKGWINLYLHKYRCEHTISTFWFINWQLLHRVHGEVELEIGGTQWLCEWFLHKKAFVARFGLLRSRRINELNGPVACFTNVRIINIRIAYKWSSIHTDQLVVVSLHPPFSSDNHQSLPASTDAFWLLVDYHFSEHAKSFQHRPLFAKQQSINGFVF